jgi:hypothetical protein
VQRLRDQAVRPLLSLRFATTCLALHMKGSRLGRRSFIIPKRLRRGTFVPRSEVGDRASRSYRPDDPDALSIVEQFANRARPIHFAHLPAIPDDDGQLLEPLMIYMPVIGTSEAPVFSILVDNPYFHSFGDLSAVCIGGRWDDILRAFKSEICVKRMAAYTRRPSPSTCL